MFIQTAALGLIAWAAPLEMPRHNPVINQTNMAAVSQADPPPVPEDESEWRTRMTTLAQYMCVIVRCQSTQTWGIDTLDQEIESWISAYNTSGLRTDMTTSETEFAIENMLDMQAMCVGDPGVLDPSQRLEFMEVLMQALDEIGAGRSAQ